jgi:hypothetical protein
MLESGYFTKSYIPEISIKEIKVIFTKLFSYTSAKYTKKFILQENWNQLTSWTLSNKKEFTDYLEKFLHKQRNLDDIVKRVKTNQGTIRIVGEWALTELKQDVNKFVETYGWKLK